MTDATDPGESLASDGELTDPPADAAPHVIVVGGGIAGLVVAHDLLDAGVRVTLVEASDRLGGKVQPHTIGGIELDSGAESFATRGGTVALLVEELGMSHALVEPAAGGAWLQPVAGPALPLPRSGLLGIPSVPLASDVIAVVGLRGALRAQLDALMSGFVGSRERTLGALVRKRMGSAVLDRLVTPVAGSVHSAHPDALDVDVVAPGLRTAVLSEGSLAHAVTKRRGAASAGSAVHGLYGGVFLLAEALAADVSARADVHFGVRATAVTRSTVRTDVSGPDAGAARYGADSSAAAAAPAPAADPSGADPPHVDPFDTALSDAALSAAGPSDVGTGSASAGASAVGGAVLVADRVVLAAPIEEAPGTPIVLITLVMRAPGLDPAPRGTGVLVAPGAPGIRAKALTHATAKWAWLRARAGGAEVLRLSYDADAAASVPDLVEQAVADASRLLGVPLSRSELVASALVEWTGPPTAAREHEGVLRVGEVVAGAGLAGIVAQAHRQARELIADLRDAAALRWDES